MVFLRFFIHLILPAVLWPLSRFSLNRNEYKGTYLGVNAAGSYGWQPCHLHVPTVWHSWEPQTPGALAAYLDLHRDGFYWTKFGAYRIVLRGGLLPGQKEHGLNSTGLEQHELFFFENSQNTSINIQVPQMRGISWQGQRLWVSMKWLSRLSYSIYCLCLNF